MSKHKFDIVIVCFLILFSFLAWIAKDKIKQHVAVSAFGVLTACFLANASVLLPSSSILIVVEYSLIIDPFLVALCGSFGASLGEMTGFYVGKHGRIIVPDKFMNWVKAKLERHNCLLVLLFSILPLPVFDVVGILSGAMKMNALKFFGICFVGKLIKMLCYALLARELLPILE